MPRPRAASSTAGSTPREAGRRCCAGSAAGCRGRGARNAGSEPMPGRPRPESSGTMTARSASAGTVWMTPARREDGRLERAPRLTRTPAGTAIRTPAASAASVRRTWAERYSGSSASCSLTGGPSSRSATSRACRRGVSRRRATSSSAGRARELGRRADLDEPAAAHHADAVGEDAGPRPCRG